MNNSVARRTSVVARQNKSKPFTIDISGIDKMASSGRFPGRAKRWTDSLACDVRRATCGQKNLGVALLSVLWLLVLLSVVASGLSYSSRQAANSVGSQVGSVEARYLAEGAVQLALMNLLSRDEDQRMLGDSETLTFPLDEGVVELTLTDENGKIDINLASEELFARLFMSFELPRERSEALAAAIADFRDEDDLNRLNGAEIEDYEAAGLTYGPKNSLFDSVDELRLVYGMEIWIYNAIQPYITTYSHQRGVNLEVAPLQVLMALSSESVNVLESYIEERRRAHENSLPLPPPPTVDRSLVSRTRGITYTLSAVGQTVLNRRSGVTTVVRLRRGNNRVSIETLNWQPWKKVQPITNPVQELINEE